MKSFRHSSDERNSTKVLKLRMNLGAAGYGIYMMLLERLAAEPDRCSELDYDVLAYDFHVEPELVRQVVEDFDLFDIDLDAETFSHPGISQQLSRKAKRARRESPLDEYIEQRLADDDWLDNMTMVYVKPRAQIREIMQNSFRTKILEKYTRIPPAITLETLLSKHLTDPVRS